MGATALPTMPFRSASTLTFFNVLGYPIGALAVSAMSPMAVLVFRFGLAGAILCHASSVSTIQPATADGSIASIRSMMPP